MLVMMGTGNNVTILGISLLSVILLGGFAFEDAFAADRFWDGGGAVTIFGGSLTQQFWADPLNWDGDTLPTGADNISIVNTCPTLINFNVSPFTLSSTSTLTIGASCDVQLVDIINQGTIDIVGTFRPSGNFDNQGTMNINQGAGDFVGFIGLNTQNSGQINHNSGQITIPTVNGKLTNTATGTITNNANIGIAGSTSVLLNQGTIDGTGTISNNGTIEEDCGSSITGQTISGSGTRTNVCATPDTTAPVITRLGSSPVDVELNTDTYTDAGATALDDVDGDITGSIVTVGDTVDETTLGVNVVTYDVDDAAGNSATQVTRTVNVVDTLDPTGSITSPTNGDVFNIASPPTTVTGTASDIGSGLASIEVTTDNGGSFTTLASTASPWSFDITGLADGDYTIFARITDNVALTFDTPSITITVDTTPPEATTTLSGVITPGTDDLINDADDTGTLTVTVTYDELMDETTTPDITFNVAAVETGGTLTETSTPAGWATVSGVSVYTTSFAVADVQADFDSVIVTADGATDLAGNDDIGDAAPTFEVDMLNPIVAPAETVVVSATLINDALVSSLGHFNVTIGYNEAMITDGSADPTITFDSVVSSTLGASPSADEWLDSLTYRATYTLADNGVDVNEVDIATIVGAKDVATNTQIAYSGGITAGSFEIDTLNPTMAVPTLDENNQGEARVEGNNDLSAKAVPFDVTSDDAQNPANPTVSCEETVDPTPEAGDNSGGDDTDYDFDSFSFIPGVHGMTCVSTDSNGNTTEDTFDAIVSEVVFNSISDTSPFWDQEMSLTATVYGWVDDVNEKVTVTFGTDGSVDVDIPDTADPTTGHQFTEMHTFPKALSDTDQTISAQLLTNPVYADMTPQVVHIDKHLTEIIMTSGDIADGIIWGLEVNKAGSVVDTFYAGNPVIPGSIVTFGGDGQGEFPFSAVAIDGTFSETERTHLLTAPTPGVTLSIGAPFSGIFSESEPTSQFYASAATIDDSYTTVSHSTEITLDDISSVPAGTPITVTGTLFDTSLTPNEGLGKVITLTAIISDNPEDNEDAAITIDDEAAISVAHPIQVSGNFELTADKVLRLDSDDVLIFDSNPHFVVLTLTNMGDNVVEFLVTGPGMQLDVTASGQDLNDGKFTLEGNAGVSRIEITSVSGTGTIGVSKIDLVNIADVSTFDSDSDLSAADSRVYTADEDFFLGEGNYDTIGTTGPGESYTIEVTASFGGDARYDAIPVIDQPSKSVLLGSNAGASGSGGLVTIITADAGVGILSVSCTTDLDKDALCDEWEASGTGSGPGIPYTVNGNPYFYPLPGTDTGTPDLLLEIDSMTPHAPLQASLDAVTASFASNSINVIATSLTTVDETIPHLDLVSVWKDSDNDFTNDFNSIKSRFFGDSTERVTLGGAQAQNFGTQKFLLTFDKNLSDESGNGEADATVSGTTTFVAGTDGLAFNFDGSTVINQGTTSTWNLLHDGSPYSVSFWTRSSDVSNTPVFLDTSAGGGFGNVGFILFTLSNGQVFLQTTNGGGTGTVITMVAPAGTLKADGEWHHYAVTFDETLASDNAKLYVDGDLLDTATASQTPSTASHTKALTIGGLPVSNKLVGDMDDLRIYDHALDSNQISRIFDSAIPSPVSGYLFENNPLIDDEFGTNDATVSGTTTFVDGNDGDGFSFDGSTIINQGDTSTWKILHDGSQYSIATWVRTTNLSNYPMFVDTNVGGGFGNVGLLLFALPDGTLWLQSTNGGGTGPVVQMISPPGTVKTDGEYHHYLVTFDGTLASDNAKMYVDGVLVKQVSTTQAPSTAAQTTTLTIGGWLFPSNRLIGDMDDFRIYDFALDSTQAETLAESSTLLNSIIRISGITMTTPPNSATTPPDSTEGTLTLNLKITTDGSSTLSEDPFREATVTGAATGFTFGTPKISTAITVVANEHSLTVSVPFSTTGVVDSLTPGGNGIGTVTIPLKSSSFVTLAEISVGSPKVSTTLLDAKAQGFRYVMFVHGIGGSSGQAELRGNDIIIALGDGFSDSVDGHVGSVGSENEQSGTLMHELGHILNLQHAGPRYLLSDPNTTLDTAAQNCVPIQDSVMGYTGQFSTYKGTDWTLDFASASGISLSELSRTANVDLTSVGSPNIVWATPATDLQQFLKGPADGVTALDWDGSGTVDGADTTGTLDLNDYGIAGCRSTPDSVFVALDEWSNLDFDFRQGPTGQFDGGEINNVILDQQNSATNIVDIIPPLKLDGEDSINAGSNLPLKFTLSKNTADGSFDPVIRGDIEAVVLKEGVGGVYESLGFFPYNEDAQQYHLNWNTDKDEVGIFGIKYLFPNPGADIEFITLIDSSSPTDFRVNGDLVSILFESTDSKVKGKSGK